MLMESQKVDIKCNNFCAAEISLTSDCPADDDAVI